jgi:uncharacterized protein YjbI with pentapeptide repeats
MLYDANLTGANLGGANLKGAKLNGVIIDDGNGNQYVLGPFDN